MHYYEVAPTRIIRAGAETFTYSSSFALPLGAIVKVPIGKTTAIGIVWEEVKKPSYPVKEIGELIEESPLPLPLIKTLGWMSQYYSTPLAQTLNAALPAGIQKKRRSGAAPESVVKRDRTTFVLNKNQQAALRRIESGKPSVLLHGITGSGKTAVYIEAAKSAIASGKSVMVIVPEIALTTQLVAEFKNHFENILLTHSGQTEASRHNTWRQALNDQLPIVMIGPRSALFAPLRNVGLIVIDECHEPSLKQEKSPRYSALRVASVLAEAHQGTVVFGSATPLVSDYYLAAQHTDTIANLPNLAKSTASKPRLSLVDMTKRDNFTQHRFLSNQLLTSIDEALEQKGQALIFHNRRGSTLVTLCKSCGWQAGCPHCYIPLTLHNDKHALICHICGLQSKIPTSCPECKEVDIIHKGIGTKLIETELTKFYPNKKIVRFDSDNSTEQTLEKYYQQLYEGEVDIIIGTQVVAKGLDLPHLRTVGVVQADSGLALPDYSASERTFQLLAQAIGRVGRTENNTSVIVQSYQPNHPSITFGINQDYQGFYDYALEVRKRSNFPPFCYLLKLTVSYKTEASAVKNSKALASELKNKIKDIEIMGPTPAFRERIGDNYRWQLILKSPKRERLIEALKYLPKTNWQFELDPLNLL